MQHCTNRTTANKELVTLLACVLYYVTSSSMHGISIAIVAIGNDEVNKSGCY